MAKVCQITGKKAMTGNNVSHSNHRTKRKFNPNLQKRRFYIPETGEWITLQVSAKGIRIINRKGISAVIKEARKNGNILV